MEHIKSSYLKGKAKYYECIIDGVGGLKVSKMNNVICEWFLIRLLWPKPWKKSLKNDVGHMKKDWVGMFPIWTS